MLGEALDAAEAGFKVGYESPTPFSREYRRLFGAPPRRDMETFRHYQGPATAVSTRETVHTTVGRGLGMAPQLVQPLSHTVGSSESAVGSSESTAVGSSESTLRPSERTVRNAKSIR